MIFSTAVTELGLFSARVVPENGVAKTNDEALVLEGCSICSHSSFSLLLSTIYHETSGSSKSCLLELCSLGGGLIKLICC